MIVGFRIHCSALYVRSRLGLTCKRQISSAWKHVKPATRVVTLGRTDMTISTGELARFSDASAEVQVGGTSVLAVLVWKNSDKVSNMLPLTVTYRQRLASLGRIPKSFDRRDRFESPGEILTSRLIDRCIRPVFDSGLCPSIELNCNVLADDFSYDPDVVAINAASLSLGLSTLPWKNPVGAVRVGLSSTGKIIVNPSRSERYDSDIDLVLSADIQGNITAIQACADRVTKSSFIDALSVACSEATKVANIIGNFSSEFGKKEADSISNFHFLPENAQKIYDSVSNDLFTILNDSNHNKLSRDEAIKRVRQNLIDKTKANDQTLSDDFDYCFFEVIGRCIKRNAIDHERRSDGRSLDELRPIDCRVNMLSPLHGSALFCRGQTQVLCRLTFDSLSSAERLDPISAKIKGQLHKHFMLHYEFPKYSTGDLSVGRGINRRELGHGNLAEMGIAPVVPKDYGFAIKLLAEVLESNGSSSMASICAASLALYDAGVPIIEPAAGVAIGLLSDRDEEGEILRHRLLTDILGFEDFFGEMDFKLAGTKSGGITALQCDVKKGGLPLRVAYEAIDKGISGIRKIIDIMDSTIDEPRKFSRNDHLPATKDVDIPKYKIASIIGPSRLYVRDFEERGVIFNIISDTSISVFAPNKSLMNEVLDFLQKKCESLSEPTFVFGATYNAKVENVLDTGVHVTLYQNQRPVFISCGQLDAKAILHPSAAGIEEGSTIKVKYFGLDPNSGKMRLSRKALLVPGSSLPDVDFHERPKERAK